MYTYLSKRAFPNEGVDLVALQPSLPGMYPVVVTLVIPVLRLPSLGLVRSSPVVWTLLLGVVDLCVMCECVWGGVQCVSTHDRSVNQISLIQKAGLDVMYIKSRTAQDTFNQ